MSSPHCRSIQYTAVGLPSLMEGYDIYLLILVALMYNHLFGFLQNAKSFIPSFRDETVLVDYVNSRHFSDTDMVSFISYFESTWVRTSTTSPLFSHDMWNQHDATPLI